MTIDQPSIAKFGVAACLRYRFAYVHVKVLLTPDKFTHNGQPAYLVQSVYNPQPYVKTQKEVEQGDWVEMPESYSQQIQHWFPEIPLLIIQQHLEGSAQQKPTFLYPLGSHVTHKKTGGIYEIKITPDEGFIEATGEPAYSYKALNDGRIWHRTQTLMEDGRFEAIVLPVAAIAQ